MYHRYLDLTHFKNLWKDEVQLVYKGPFEENVLMSLGSYIKKKYNPANRLFSVFIELAQNIAFYSANTSVHPNDKDYGIGLVMVAEGELHYSLIAGNVVKNETIITLIEKCEQINSLDREGLRQLKLKQLRLPRGQKGGAHIGLIQIALTSTNPLEFQVVPIDHEQSFFSLAVRINKFAETEPTLEKL